MRKQLLSNSAQFFLRKLPFKIIIFTALSLFTFYSSFAQQWTILGNENQVSSVASAYTSIAVIDSVPYVVFREGATAGRVKRKNFNTGNWEQIGNDIGANVTYTRIYVGRKNNLLVSYVDAGNGNKLAVKAYNDTTGLWEPLNNDINNLYVSSGSVTYTEGRFSSTPRSSMAFDSDNNPYIAFGEGANLTPYVRKFDGTSWVTLGSGPVNATDTAVGVSLVVDELDIPWLAFVNLASATSTSGSMALFSYNSGTWTAAAANTITGIRHTSMALNSAGNPAIAYFNTGNSNRATVVVYDKTAGTWGTATALSSRDAPNLSLIRDISGNLYCSFIDFIASTPRSVSRVFKQSAGVTAWRELKDPTVTTGIADTTSNLTIAAGSDSSKPFIVYTQPNSTSVSTPVVRMYTPPPPPAVLTTNEISTITFTSAVAGGNITSDGGSAITERGVVYSTTANPTTANTKVVAGTGGTGSFTVTLTGLAPSTFYYVRAYAVNGGGVPTYGNTVNLFSPPAPDAVVTTPRQMEFLTRGVVAVRTSGTKVYVSWRLLGTDTSGIAFNVYRDGVQVNATPVSTSTNFEDNTAVNGSYTVKPVINGVEGAASAPVSVWATNQLTIPLQIPAGGTTPDGVAYTYSANDASVGDVDGDGEYEIFVKWDPSNSKDNSQSGYTGNVYIDCYKMNGTRLWRIDLGRNIRAGAHYTQFMVYDFDGDGKAEMMCKTADATIDGVGTIIGNINADYRNTSGYVLSGPEFLTVFNGLTGAAMATQNYIPARGTVSSWGDSYGNRVDRFIAAVAYLDGQRPSAVFGRGYYTRLVRAAWDWRNGQLTNRWVFDSNNPGSGSFAGMGNHQMSVADVDGDGKDEIINGSSTINDDGKGLWSDGKGHGDALHVTDMDPDRPGQELWMNHEEPNAYTPYGLRLKDAKTGATQWGITTSGDVGRSMAADIDPSHKGFEVWGSSGNLYDIKGNQISTNKPTYNFGIWWDGDLSRELLDGTKMDKWNYINNSLGRLFTIYNAAPISSNNSTKANPCLQADLFGDWREEMIFRYSDNTALVIFTTNIPTTYRFTTLMHDPQYRAAIAWQNSAYNQPPYPSYYIGYDMPTPPASNIYIAAQASLPVKLLSFNATKQDGHVLVEWSATNEVNSSYYVVERSSDGKDFSAVQTVVDKGNTGGINYYSFIDNQPLDGTSYYRLKQVDADGKYVYSEVKKISFSKTQQLIVYPNPASSFVKLELPQTTGNLIITIHNANGRLVYQDKGSLTQLNNKVNSLLPGLAPGYYHIEVTDKASVYKAQLIKQ